VLHRLLLMPYPEDDDTTFMAYVRAVWQSPAVLGRILMTVILCLLLATPYGWPVSLLASFGSQIAILAVTYPIWRRTSPPVG
jgi:ABC-type spermidine/putrescine transport system permease subunit I